MVMMSEIEWKARVHNQLKIMGYDPTERWVKSLVDDLWMEAEADGLIGCDSPEQFIIDEVSYWESY